MNPSFLPLAALTVMLWILWSDSVRPNKPHRAMYFARVVMYLTMAGVLVYNFTMQRHVFRGFSLAVVIAAALVAIAGAVYFFRRATARA